MRRWLIVATVLLVAILVVSSIWGNIRHKQRQIAEIKRLEAQVVELQERIEHQETRLSEIQREMDAITADINDQIDAALNGEGDPLSEWEESWAN
jgi:uncharacterized protein YlxW (UPF0749 family)